MKTKPYILYRNPSGDYDHLPIDRLSHEPVRFKMPEDLPRHDWPCIPALRVTPLDNLTVMQMRALAVHHHDGQLDPDHMRARQRVWWYRQCEALGDASISGISHEQVEADLALDRRLTA